MRILINLKGYYEWRPVDKSSTPKMLALPKTVKDSDGKKVILSGNPNYKVDANGNWLKKTQVDEPTYTEVSIHESEIENVSNHFERVGSPKTRGAVIGWYLEEHVMPQHASQDDWTHIEVEKEPDVEKYLNNRFELNKKEKSNGKPLSNTSTR